MDMRATSFQKTTDFNFVHLALLREYMLADVAMVDPATVRCAFLQRSPVLVHLTNSPYLFPLTANSSMVCNLSIRIAMF
jgi:hypothetical protein